MDAGIIAEVFSAMDHDGSNTLDVDELKQALQTMGISASDKECATLFSAIDADKSGTVDKDEFFRFVCAESVGEFDDAGLRP